MFWDLSQDEVDLLFEIHGQETVGLIENQEFQSLKIEALRVSKMIGRTTWSSHDDVRLLGESDCL